MNSAVNRLCQCNSDEYIWWESQVPNDEGNKKCVYKPCVTLDPSTPVRYDFKVDVNDKTTNGCKATCGSNMKEKKLEGETYCECKDTFSWVEATKKCEPIVDCVLTWPDEWEVCDKDCGTGTQKKTAAVTTPASNGGTPCGNTLKEQTCKIKDCPVDCAGSYGPWSKCDCSTAKRG